MDSPSWTAAWFETEAKLASSVGLTQSQLQFVLAFFASFPLSALFRLVPTAAGRHLYSVLTGIALLMYPFGLSIVYIAPPVVVAYLAMVLVPRHAGAVAWGFAMPYLIYWHEVGASGTAWREGTIDFTGALMVATLKIISSATNLSDSFKDEKNQRSSERQWMISKAPGPLEYCSYIVSVGNLLAGPHFHIKPYLQFVSREGLWSQSAARKMPNPVPQGLWHLLQALVCMVLHLGLSHAGFAVSTFTTDRFFKAPYLMRVVLLWAIGFTTRWKFYYVWSLAHSAMVVSGFSFLGFTEEGKPDWERGRNQDILGLELCKSAAEIPLNWNIQTGMWLRYYCYDRLTPIGKKPGFLPLLLTQLVSGVWHGLLPGYVMFFSGSAVMVFSSRVIYGHQKHLKSAGARAVAKFAHGIYTSVCLNFLASAFQLLTWEESIAVWRSMYFGPLVIMVAICVLGPLVPSRRGMEGGGANARLGGGNKAAAGGGKGGAAQVEVHAHGSPGIRAANTCEERANGSSHAKSS